MLSQFHYSHLLNQNIFASTDNSTFCRSFLLFWHYVKGCLCCVISHNFASLPKSPRRSLNPLIFRLRPRTRHNSSLLHHIAAPTLRHLSSSGPNLCVLYPCLSPSNKNVCLCLINQIVHETRAAHLSEGGTHSLSARIFSHCMVTIWAGSSSSSRPAHRSWSDSRRTRGLQYSRTIRVHGMTWLR